MTRSTGRSVQLSTNSDFSQLTQCTPRTQTQVHKNQGATLDNAENAPSKLPPSLLRLSVQSPAPFINSLIICLKSNTLQFSTALGRFQSQRAGSLEARGSCSPCPRQHPRCCLLSSILSPQCHLGAELTADIYLAYLISSAGFAFYSQLRPLPPPLPAASPQP